MNAGRAIGVAGAAIALGALAVGTVTAVRWPPATGSDVPTARVIRGALTLDVHVTGELRARRSVPMTAPPAGGSLNLVRMTETGTAVRTGDVIMEFDPADQAHALEQSRSELLEAEQEIVKMRADAEVQAAQAEVDLLTARFDVRRADLDAAAGPELIGRVAAQRRALAVEEARRRLTELENSLASREATDRAAFAVLEERRTQARLASERAQRIIDSLVVRAPIDGVVVVRENRDTTTVFFSGMTLPDYRVGDTVRPGRIVLEVVEVSQLEILARVGEHDRPNLEAGQPATLSVNGLAGEPLPATVGTIAGMASRGAFFAASGPVRQFDAVLRLDRPDPRLRPGMTVQVVVAGRELRDVLHVPRQAIFEREGRSIVYIDGSGVFEPQPVQVISGTEGRVAIEGITEGAVVALVNPENGDLRDRPTSPQAAVQ